MTYCSIILTTNLSSIIVFSYLLISIELGCYCDPIFFDHEANSELFIYSSSVVHCLLSLCQELFYLQHSKGAHWQITFKDARLVYQTQCIYYLVLKSVSNVTQANKFRYILHTTLLDSL